MLDDILAASLEHMTPSERGDLEGNSESEASSPLVLVQLLGGMLAAGASVSGAWLSAWSGLMDADKVARLGHMGHGPVLQLVEILAQERMGGLRPSVK